MPQLVLFDDGRGDFGPMTDLRPAFQIRSGMLTTAARIEAAVGRDVAALIVPDHLAALVAAHADVPVNTLPDGSEMLLVNGRWTRPDVSRRPDHNRAIVEAETGDVIMARLDRATAEAYLADGALPDSVQTTADQSVRLARYPWHIIADAHDTVAQDIVDTRLLDTKVLSREDSVIGEHPVEIHESAKVYPHVVFDAENGPISVHQHVTIRPHAVITGPCSIGAGSTVLDHAVIKANTVIGPKCKVAGEIGATIFQGYANKAHDGHLGDSWVGKWVNFGAGTTNSNLLNTYGEVVMRLTPDGRRHRTGMTFLGAIVGDHAKFAINTRLMTGSVIGTGSMIASTAAAPTSVPPFAWLTDDGMRTYRLDKFLDVMRAVMARRNVEPDESYIARIRALFDAAAPNADA